MEAKEDEGYFKPDEKPKKDIIEEEGFKWDHARIYSNRLLISMVGLPARGKTHISRKLTRYLTWLGYNAKTFNIGDKRRKTLGVQDTAKSDFFSNTNMEACRQREQLAVDTLTDVVKFLNSSPGNIAIFDGTNTTKSRRKKIKEVVETYIHDTDLFFLELICHDQEQIERNIIKTKTNSPDFVGWNEEEIIKDFKERIHQYEMVYEEVGDISSLSEKEKKDPDDFENTIPFIKIINNNERVISQNIQGFLNLQILTYLLHLHLEDRPLYLARHGESEFNLEGRIGGDASITERGKKFAKMLNEFFIEEHKKVGWDKFIVNTSTLKRAIETGEFLDESTGIYSKKPSLKVLDEINAGICDSLTYNEIEERYPEIFVNRKQNKIGYRYPKGESYYDVITRIQSYLVELERVQTPVIVISHNAIMRCLYGYFAVLKVNCISEIEIPLHTVIKITPQTYGYKEEIFSFDTETGKITSYPSLNDKLIADSIQKHIEIKGITRKVQRLSFDDTDISDINNELNSASKIGRKIFSSHDVFSMQDKPIPTAKKGLKRVNKFSN